MSSSRMRGSLPRASGPALEVLRVVTTSPRRFTILSSSWWGKHFHLYANRSHDCAADNGGECPRCKEGWPQKWRAYAHVQPWGAEGIAPPKPAILELTKAAIDQVEGLLPEGITLRGVKLEVSKTRGGAKGRYLCNTLPGIVEEALLLPELDPEPILRILWNWNTKGSIQK